MDADGVHGRGPERARGVPDGTSRLTGAVRLSDDPRTPSGPREPRASPLDPASEEAIAGVLRWLLGEVGAEAVAYLHLGTEGEEKVMVEPRGLAAQDLLALVRRARYRLEEGVPEERPLVDESSIRWSAPLGASIIVFEGAPPGSSADTLRSAQTLIEGILALQEVADGRELERRVRAIPGVAWVEYHDDESPALRVLVAEDVDAEVVRAEVEHAVAGSGVAVEWVEPEPDELREPRPRLVKVLVEMDGESVAEVHLKWNGERLEGHGNASASPAGRFHAVAYATADALRSLLDDDIRVEGLYSALTQDQEELLMAVVQAKGERLVGAVLSRPGEEDLSAARAILDAVNRRLPHMISSNGQEPDRR